MTQYISLAEKSPIVHEDILSCLRALSYVAGALIVNYYAVRYATQQAGAPLPDIVLDVLPALDTHFIDYYLAFYVQLAAALFACTQGLRGIFFMKAAALLILVRSVFINMTHLGIPPGGVPTTSFFTQGGDLFFSGHVALPFLAALVFWNMPRARCVFLLISMLMAIEVLLGHQHYTIDVIAAPYITFGVYMYARRIFREGKSI